MSRRVYFIRPVGMDGPIKIGCSQSPEYRRSALATWSPFPLEIVAEIDGCYRMERQFHALFFDQHEHHEWFAWSPALQATIDAVVAGTFYVSTLPEPKRIPAIYRSPKVARKWTEEQKATNRRWRELRRVERVTGLVPDYPLSETVDAFLADPQAHGITAEERWRRVRLREAEQKISQAQATLTELSDHHPSCSNTGGVR